jgi:hypothetical protein
MAIRPVFRALVAAGLTTAVLGAPTFSDAETPEARDPTQIELLPAVEAAFPRESYAPGDTASLVVWNRAPG